MLCLLFIVQASIATDKYDAITDLSKPVDFSGADGEDFAKLERQLKEVQASSFAEVGHGSSLQDLNQALRKIQRRADAKLQHLRAKHRRTDPDAAEDAIFRKLSAEESKNYKELYAKMGDVSGRVAAKLHVLKQGASSFLEDGERLHLQDATGHFDAVYSELTNLKQKADLEVRKLEKRILGEPSSLLQRQEIQYKNSFEDLDAQLSALQAHTKEQVRELTQDSRVAAMNAGPQSLLQDADIQVPSSFIEDPAAELKSEFTGDAQQFQAKMRELQLKSQKQLDKLKGELNVPYPSSLLEAGPASDELQASFSKEKDEFQAKMAELEQRSAKQLEKLRQEESDVPVPASLLETGARATYQKYAKGHEEFEAVLKKLKGLKASTQAKIEAIRRNARIPESSFAELYGIARAPGDLDKKLKAIQAATDAKIKALIAKAKPSSLLETGGDVPNSDLGKEISQIELQTRDQLANLVGNQDLFKDHDLPSSLLERRRLERARRAEGDGDGDAPAEESDASADAPADAQSGDAPADAQKDEDAADKDALDAPSEESEEEEIKRELEAEEGDAAKPGVEGQQYKKVQDELKAGMAKLRDDLKHYGETIAATPAKDGEEEDLHPEPDEEPGEPSETHADEDPGQPSETHADEPAEPAADEGASLLEKATSQDFLAAPKALLEQRDKVATAAATRSLTQEYERAFKTGFSQGLQQAGLKHDAHLRRDPESLLESKPDPPMFAELDKVEDELRSLKSDVGKNFDKVTALVNPDGTWTQTRQ